MFFVIDCQDKLGHLAVRLENRDAHLNYLKDFEQQLIMAGPFVDSDNQMIGSMLIMDFNDRGEADSFCAADPYALAGLFERVQIRPWRKALPA
jgi:uncharacterized protein YciI